jgi:transposase
VFTLTALEPEEAEMRIIGVDLHTRQQTVAMLDTETGELIKKTLKHDGDEVRKFYSALPDQVLVGIEATGSMHWFLELLEELGIEGKVGHPAKIRAAEPRKQKYDGRDAALLLKLQVENRFPSIWMPSTELRDLRTLLLHRHQWVRMRTRVQNTLQAIALGHGLRRGKTLWSQLGQHTMESLPLPPHAAHRRTELLALYGKLQAQIDELDERVMNHAQQRPGARLLMTHPGVGPVTALATDVFLGDPARFEDGKAVVSYVGMIPSEYSSGGQQRLGGLSKQGSPFLRFLWCEAAVHAARRDPDLQRFYRRKLTQKGLGKARVAVARKLGIRLYIMLRDQIDYQEFCRRGQMRQKSGDACAGMPDVGHSPAIQ